MIYIMVTNWDGHWDRLRDNSTYYTSRMLKGNLAKRMPVSGTKTIFIKRNRQTREIEKCWEGKIYDLKKDRLNDKDIIRFRVEIEKEISCLSKYISYSEGWWPDEEELVEKIATESICDPKFFSLLKSTFNWQEFEEYIHYLIRSLGIHISHRFGPTKQKGKADGFFKFNNLAVLYDCTLDSNFEESKDTQIDNFCDQLQKGKIEYESKNIGIKQCTKNVWIITRGFKSRIIKEIDEVIVKEVPIDKLIELYRERLEKDIDEKEFEIKLQNI